MLKPPPSYLLRETTQVVWRIARHLRVTWMNRWKIRSLNDSLNENCGPVCKWTHATTKFQRRWWKICAWNMYIYIYMTILFLLIYWDMICHSPPFKHYIHHASYLPFYYPKLSSPLGFPNPRKETTVQTSRFLTFLHLNGGKVKGHSPGWHETSFRIGNSNQSFHLPLLLGGGAVDPNTVFLLYVQINDSSRAIWMFVLSMKFQWIFENPYHPSVLTAQMFMSISHTPHSFHNIGMSDILEKNTFLHSTGKSQIFDTFQKAKRIKYACYWVRTISL